MYTPPRKRDYSPEQYRTKFEDYVHGFEHEHELIDRKETWLLTSQTILFAALSLTLQAPSVILVQVIAAVGLSLCGAIILGLAGNISAKWCLYSDYKALENSSNGTEKKIRWGIRGTGKVEFGVRTRLTMMGVITDVLIPLAFASAWIYVLIRAGDIVEAAKIVVTKH